MRKGGRKLLVASLGVGAISYVAACGGSVANLMAPPQDASADSAPDSASDGKTDTAADGLQDQFFPRDLIANLVAPSE
jgi:hypothetical protein